MIRTLNKVTCIIFISTLILNCQSTKPMQAPTLETPEQVSPALEKRIFKPFIGDKWIGNAISYGCYRLGQEPHVKGPSEAEILEDLIILKDHWNLIRVYGSDNGLNSDMILKVIHDNNLPIRVMLGVWLTNETLHPETRAGNQKEVLKGIELANQYPDEVIAVSVGNETQVWWSGHRMNPDTLIKYIRQVRQSVSVPVTTADDYNFWNKPESQTIAAEIDFIVLHAYALWNGQELDHATAWTDSVYRDAQVRHSDQTIVLGETGWATVYNPEKQQPWEQGALIKGEVSIQAQEKFIADLNKWIEENHIVTFLFEAFDEPWKGGGSETGPTEVEKNWGVFYEDRTPKPSFQKYLESLKIGNN